VRSGASTRRLEILSRELSVRFIEGSAEVCRPIRRPFQLGVVHFAVLPERICEAVLVAEQELRREMASQYRNARLQAQSLGSSSVARISVFSVSGMGRRFRPGSAERLQPQRSGTGTVRG
jgi:hypothetical protein